MRSKSKDGPSEEQSIHELKKCKVPEDFLALLEELLECRNYIAHNLLLDHALLGSMAGVKGRRLSEKPPRQGLFVVEQTIHVHDFLTSNGYL